MRLIIVHNQPDSYATAEICPPNIAVVQGAPHWLLNEDNANDFMAAFIISDTDISSDYSDDV